MPAPITTNAYENSVRYQNFNSEPVLAGFEADKEEQKHITEFFRNGWTAWEKDSKITFKINGKGIAVQYRKSVKQPTPIAQIVIDGDTENAMLLDGNFDQDWGDCLHIDTVARNLKPGEHTVEITIVQTNPADVVPFYLVSVIGSN